MRRRKTVLIAAVIAMVLGSATSIALAWSLAAFREFPMYPRPVLGAFVQWDRGWSVSENQIFGIVDIWWSEIGDGAGRTPADVLDQVQERRSRYEKLARSDDRTTRHRPRWWGTFTLPQPPDRGRGADMGFGWPLPCLWEQITSEIQGNTMLNDVLHGGWLLRGRPSGVGRSFHALPLRPIWRGLLVNSLFFACLWFIALLGPPTLRRAIRRRRGCCPLCGYDLRALTSTRCPECGSPHS